MGTAAARRDMEGEGRLARGSGKDAPVQLGGVGLPFLGVLRHGPCPCSLKTPVIPHLRVRIPCSVFPFPSEPHRDLAGRQFLGSA